MFETTFLFQSAGTIGPRDNICIPSYGLLLTVVKAGTAKAGNPPKGEDGMSVRNHSLQTFKL